MPDTAIKPFEAIPFVPLPRDFQTGAGAFLMNAYAEHGAIFRSQLGGEEIVFLVGPEACRFVLTLEREKFSVSEGWRIVTRMFGKGLLTMDGAEHTAHRRAMNPAFTLAAMEPHLPLMHRIIEQYASQWRAAGTVDLYEEARHITFDIAAQALIGFVPGDDLAGLRQVFLEIVDLTRLDNDKDDYKRQLKSLRDELFARLAPQIQHCRQQPGLDALSQMITSFAEHHHPIADEQLIAHANVLLIAGHETTTSLMTWVLTLLIQHPHYWQRVLAEQKRVIADTPIPTMEQLKRLSVLDCVLSEAERLYPPIGNGPRRTTADVTFNGYHIPSGTRVFYSIVATHLLPEIFAEPARFDPDRFLPPREEHKHPYSLIGFGGGPRTCLGINFAQIEIKLAVLYVLSHYQLTLLPDQTLVQQYRGLTGLPLNGVKVQVQPAAGSQ